MLMFRYLVLVLIFADVLGEDLLNLVDAVLFAHYVDYANSGVCE